MTDSSRRARRDAIRAEYAAEAAEAEAVEAEQAVVSVRVPASLAEALKARAAAEHLPTSALVRRIPARAVQSPEAPAVSVEQVEEIVRRVLRESA
ncbi:ribbon-helix-helix protein, CopG family [Parafrankia sp. FMc2]|uniref:ribbon-helix-helix protein, CopG family n=1 Tax=Parafrankia sp. FMc2 TaxID=3233196 RepID=UPI0034D4F3A1